MAKSGQLADNTFKKIQDEHYEWRSNFNRPLQPLKEILSDIYDSEEGWTEKGWEELKKELTDAAGQAASPAALKGEAMAEARQMTIEELEKELIELNLDPAEESNVQKRDLLRRLDEGLERLNDPPSIVDFIVRSKIIKRKQEHRVHINMALAVEELMIYVKNPEARKPGIPTPVESAEDLYIVEDIRELLSQILSLSKHWRRTGDPTEFMDACKVALRTNTEDFKKIRNGVKPPDRSNGPSLKVQSTRLKLLLNTLPIIRRVYDSEWIKDTNQWFEQHSYGEDQSNIAAWLTNILKYKVTDDQVDLDIDLSEGSKKHSTVEENLINMINEELTRVFEGKEENIVSIFLHNIGCRWIGMLQAKHHPNTLLLEFKRPRDPGDLVKITVPEKLHRKNFTIWKAPDGREFEIKVPQDLPPGAKFMAARPSWEDAEAESLKLPGLIKKCRSMGLPDEEIDAAIQEEGDAQKALLNLLRFTTEDKLREDIQGQVKMMMDEGIQASHSGAHMDPVATKKLKRNINDTLTEIANRHDLHITEGILGESHEDTVEENARIISDMIVNKLTKDAIAKADRNLPLEYIARELVEMYRMPNDELMEKVNQYYMKHPRAQKIVEEYKERCKDFERCFNTADGTAIELWSLINNERLEPKRFARKYHEDHEAPLFTRAESGAFIRRFQDAQDIGEIPEMLIKIKKDNGEIRNIVMGEEKAKVTQMLQEWGEHYTLPRNWGRSMQEKFTMIKLLVEVEVIANMVPEGDDERDERMERIRGKQADVKAKPKPRRGRRGAPSSDDAMLWGAVAAHPKGKPSGRSNIPKIFQGR